MAGIDLGDAWADEVWEEGVWADGVWEGQESTGSPPPGGDPGVPQGRAWGWHRAHRSWLLIPFLLLAGCGTELIGPAHPEYEARCTLYVEDEGWVDMPREMIEGCLSVRLQIIRWEG